MKKLFVLMFAVVVTALALSCARDAEGEPAGKAEPKWQNAGADTMTLRVVDGAQNGALVLAGETGVYRLPLDGLTLYMDGSSVDASAIENGMTAEVWYTGGVQETFPLLFKDVIAVSFSRGEDAQYDLCGLYLQVLEDLWNTDEGLNGGAGMISVDLSKAPGGLTAGEKEVIAYVFAQEHGAQGLTLTFDELREQGYLAAEKLEDGGTAYSFLEGLLFTITPDDSMEGESFSLPVVCFSAEKWRSPLGAYYFTKCAASRGDSGWKYTVGAEMIS